MSYNHYFLHNVMNMGVFIGTIRDSTIRTTRGTRMSTIKGEY